MRTGTSLPAEYILGLIPRTPSLLLELPKFLRHLSLKLLFRELSATLPPVLFDHTQLGVCYPAAAVVAFGTTQYIINALYEDYDLRVSSFLVDFSSVFSRYPGLIRRLLVTLLPFLYRSFSCPALRSVGWLSCCFNSLLFVHVHLSLSHCCCCIMRYQMGAV